MGYVHPGGLRFEDYVKFCADSDLLVHDAEYTPEEYRKTIEWGHSSYADALELAFQAKVKEFGMFHLNQERTDDEADEILAKCLKIVHDRGSSLRCDVVGAGTVFEL